jgi:hypothetical protein
MTTPPSVTEPTVQTHFEYAQVVNITGQIYSDQTGRFPVTSSKGNQYIMIVYDYDSAAILAEPLKNRIKQELVRAYSKLHQHLTERGLKPQLQKLDNECPAASKQCMRQANVDFQLIPPTITDKTQPKEQSGFGKTVAGLASLDPDFPMHLWCRLIHQCTQTLNLMRPSRINSRLSAEAQLNGAFAYNKTPLAPPGTKVLIHETPNKQRTWVVHGTDGWYLGGAPEHYRCYRVYATKPVPNASHSPLRFSRIIEKCLNYPLPTRLSEPPSNSAGPYETQPLLPHFLLSATNKCRPFSIWLISSPT